MQGENGEVRTSLIRATCDPFEMEQLWKLQEGLEGGLTWWRERVTEEDTTAGKGETGAVVCAWWTGNGAPHERTGGQRALAHMYATRLKPTKPLKEGGRVRLVALAKARTPAPVASIDSYDPYEPHVHGVVISIVETETGWARATIINECKGNSVAVIDLDIPYAPGVTVLMPRTESHRGGLEWLGEAPTGCGDWQDKGDGGVCSGEGCQLTLARDTGERNFRAIPKRAKGQLQGPPISAKPPAGENAFAIHLWLKYEGYS